LAISFLGFGFGLTTGSGGVGFGRSTGSGVMKLTMMGEPWACARLGGWCESASPINAAWKRAVTARLAIRVRGGRGAAGGANNNVQSPNLRELTIRMA